jgi:dephospho-CoA kinase
VINAALLHKCTVFSRLDRIILVEAPVLTRFLRALKRDKLPWGQLIKRFRTQRQFHAQYSRAHADIHIIVNRGYLGFSSRFFRRSLEKRIEALLSILEQ